MRREFSKHVRVAAFKRANGHCEECTAKLYPGHIEYDHDKEDTFGGEPTLENCRVLCSACHSRKTRKRAAVIAKSNRVRNKAAGIHTTVGRPLPGTKASGIRKRMGGRVERW